MTFPPGVFSAEGTPFAQVIDYVPPWLPGRVLTLSLSGSCVGGDFLEVAGDGLVAVCVTAASRAFIGVAGMNVPSPGPGRVTVYGRGPVHESVCDGPVTAGQQVVTSATPGRQVAAVAAPASPPTQADVNNSRAILGIALTSAPDAVKCRWMQI